MTCIRQGLEICCVRTCILLVSTWTIYLGWAFSGFQDDGVWTLRFWQMNYDVLPSEPDNLVCQSDLVVMIYFEA